MKELDRALIYFNIANIFGDPFATLHSWGTPPPVSRNTTRTKGRKFASQKSRANRRKAARR